MAAACGSDSSSSSSTAAAPTTVAAAPTTAATPATEGAASTTAAAPTDTAAGTTVDFSALKGSLVASGATFPKGFYDDAIATLAGIAPGLTVEYGGGGSGKGTRDLQAKSVGFGWPRAR